METADLFGFELRKLIGEWLGDSRNDPFGIGKALAIETAEVFKRIGG